MILITKNLINMILNLMMIYLIKVKLIQKILLMKISHQVKIRKQIFNSNKQQWFNNKKKKS